MIMKKKDYAIILLSAILSMGYVTGSAAEQQKHKPRFNLNPKQHYLKHDFAKEFSLFNNLQDRMRMTGKDYFILKAQPDNMPVIVPNKNLYGRPEDIIVPDKSKDNMPVINPDLGKEFKFLFKPWHFYRKENIPNGITYRIYI